LLVAVGICWASTELLGSDEIAVCVNQAGTQDLGEWKQAERREEYTFWSGFLNYDVLNVLLSSLAYISVLSVP